MTITHQAKMWRALAASNLQAAYSSGTVDMSACQRQWSRNSSQVFLPAYVIANHIIQPLQCTHQHQKHRWIAWSRFLHRKTTSIFEHQKHTFSLTIYISQPTPRSKLPQLCLAIHLWWSQASVEMWIQTLSDFMHPDSHRFILLRLNISQNWTGSGIVLDNFPWQFSLSIGVNCSSCGPAAGLLGGLIEHSRWAEMDSACATVPSP